MPSDEFTKPTQATGPENIGPAENTFRHPDSGAVNSPTCITLENNEKIRPQPGGENVFARASGGADGIRTHETLPGLLP